MLRLLIAAFLTLISVSAHAQSNNAWYAQAMLSRLGYQISVDGSWGPQSQRAIRQFYADQGLTYDENLNDSEFADLITAIADQPYIHPRANLVNYEPQYQFLSGSWPYLDLDEYRRKFTKNLKASDKCLFCFAKINQVLTRSSRGVITVAG